MNKKEKKINDFSGLRKYFNMEQEKNIVKAFSELSIRQEANAITAYAFRNTFLEDLHAGTSPSSKKGDYSDVKVISPFGKILWNDLSRISDEEMKKLMIESSAKIEELLELKEKNPIMYKSMILLNHWMYSKNWSTTLKNYKNKDGKR